MIDTVVYLKATITATGPLDPASVADDIQQALRWEFARIAVEPVNHNDPRA
jgi:hypothetical protein